MNHLSEEQLIAHRYGESEDRAGDEEHLRACDTCRASLAALEQVLAAVEAAPVPERDEGYGAQVWQRIRPRLEERTPPFWAGWFEPRRLAAVGALAAVLVAAFLAGRHWPSPQQVLVAGPLTTQVRERILLVAVGDHLDRAQMVLLELANADGPAAAGNPSPGLVDITSEQQRAQDLVASNRLYRQTAERTGDAAVVSLLDALEPILVEIAHSPGKISQKQLEEIRRRIEAGGILFKVRVIGSEVRQQERAPAPQPALSPGRGKS